MEGGLYMKMKEQVISEEELVTKTIDHLVEKGNQALEKMKQLDQGAIDSIVQAMALAGLDQHMPLAKLAVEETGRGVYEDKIIKNILDRKSTRLNSSHVAISYADFCLKKKNI